MRSLFWFLFGILVAIGALSVGGYLFLESGGVAMATTAKPLPLERRVAHMALRASIGNAGEQLDPLAVNASNLVAGARIYKEHCSTCHGLVGGEPTAIAKGMFPHPPQLLTKGEMVTDDPEGVTFWKVTHGIRLSGMPGFGQTLSDTDRWQATMLVAHADNLPPAVQALLKR
jgi:thiosulfate dehydrogenase